MGKKSAPPAPDYVGAAKATGEENKENTVQQIYANRPEINTPWGSQTWNTSAGIDPSTGKPITEWASDITLSPDQQAALDAQQRIQMGRSAGAEGLLDQATGALGTPMNWDELPDRASPLSQSLSLQRSLTRSPGDWRQRAQDAITKLQQPQLDRRRAAVETQLANQGITRGSEAYNAEMQRLSDEEARAHLAAIGEGRSEDQMLFGQDLASAGFGNEAAMKELQGGVQAGAFNNATRGQAISEQQARRNQALNELNALLTGQQVQNPQMPNFQTASKAQGFDLTGAMNDQYGAAMDATNARNAQTQSTVSGLATIAAMYFSDRRLKKDMKIVGMLPNGISIYQYRFVGQEDMHLGVIAQEVQRVIPDAVHADANGFLKVDYSKVLT